MLRYLPMIAPIIGALLIILSFDLRASGKKEDAKIVQGIGEGLMKSGSGGSSMVNVAIAKFLMTMGVTLLAVGLLMGYFIFS